MLLLSIFNQLALADDIKTKIAIVGPLTGQYKAYGTLMLSGAQQAVNDINKSIEPHFSKLELTPYDDKCDPNLAEIVANKIANSKKYSAVIGHVCSAAALQTDLIYAKAGILVVTPSATNMKVTQKGFSTVFRMIGRDDSQARIAASFLVSRLQSKRIAILHREDSYGKDLADFVSEHLALRDRTPVLYQGIPNGAHKFDTVIEKLKSLEVDAVYFAGFYREVGKLAQAMQQNKIQIPLLTSDGSSLKAFVTAAGGLKPARTVLMTFGHDPKRNSKNASLLMDMQNSNLETNGYSLYSYAAVEAIDAALTGAKTHDGIKLANWLHQNKVDTVLGEKSWDTNGDIINAEFAVYLWQDYDKFVSLL